MTAVKGSLMLLKIGNGATPTESFTTLGGLRTTQLRVQRQLLQDADVESGAWRSLLAESGQASLRIQGAGIFADSAADETLRSKAFSGEASNYECWFGNGDKLSGAFLVAAYERNANMKDAEGFSLVLESAGVISFTPV